MKSELTLYLKFNRSNNMRMKIFEKCSTDHRTFKHINCDTDDIDFENKTKKLEN